MNWWLTEGSSTVITLQHDRDGTIRLICKGCNSRHHLHPGDSYYQMPRGHKRCPSVAGEPVNRQRVLLHQDPQGPAVFSLPKLREGRGYGLPESEEVTVKVFLMPQLSPEWWQVRRAVPTASNFDKIMTAEKRKYSSSATKYIASLIAEAVCQTRRTSPARASQ
jgi:hypothetical protein